MSEELITNNNDNKISNKPIIHDAFLEALSLKEAKEQTPSSLKRTNVLHVLEGACMEMDKVNRNNRIYPKELVIKKILNYSNVLCSSCCRLVTKSDFI